MFTIILRLWNMNVTLLLPYAYARTAFLLDYILATPSLKNCLSLWKTANYTVPLVVFVQPWYLSSGMLPRRFVQVACSSTHYWSFFSYRQGLWHLGHCRREQQTASGSRIKRFCYILSKSFVKIGIAKTFCYNKMFGSINKAFGCCSRIFGCSNKSFMCCP